MSADLESIKQENAMLLDALGCLVYKIETEEWRGHPLHPKGHPDCLWLKDGGYPCEYSLARQLLEGLSIDGINHELPSRICNAEYTKAETPVLSADDEQAIARLAKLPLLEYDRQRRAEADRLSCQVSTLDKLVEAKRTTSNASGQQGSEVFLPEVLPWPESVNGVEVLNDVAATFTRYIVLPEGAADALALWCAHTHCFQSFECSPRLNITSPEMGCGKSVLRSVVAQFVRRPLELDNATTATLFRLIEKYSPTILDDEYDTWLFGNEELRGIINSGHRRGGCLPRCEGDANEVRVFKTFAPVALCGISHLPSTLHDRSIVIKLVRAKPGEIQARFDKRRCEREKELCRKVARFCADNKPRLEASDPQLPDGVFNRLADNWRPLFAVAEAAGGDWPKRCADSMAKLTMRELDTESLKVMLLADIQQVFNEHEIGEWIPSSELIDYLTGLTERPWAEVNRGKPINERWLSVKLRAFDIKPDKVPREGGDQRRGYHVAAFQNAFDRYLYTVPGTSGQVSHDLVLRGKTTETDSEPDPEPDVETASVSGIHEGKRPPETDVHLKRRGEEQAQDLVQKGMTSGQFIAEARQLFDAEIVP